MRTKEQQLEYIASKVIYNAKEVLTQKHLVSSGELVNSMKYRVKPNVIYIDMNEYAEFLDKGTKPHTPPIAPLKRWAKRHGNINPFAIQKNISKFGTKARPWVKVWYKSLDKLDKDFEDYLEIMIVEDFEKPLIKKGFKIK